MKRVAVLAGIVLQLCVAAPAWAALCASDTLASYIALGAAGCTISGVTLSNFTQPALLSTATPIAPTDVTLTPIANPGEFGLAFSTGSGINAGSGDLYELWFGFKASGGSGFTSNTITLATPSVTGDGVITIVEQKCLEGTYDASSGFCASGPEVLQIVFADSLDSELQQTANFAVASFFDVFIDLVVDGGLEGTAELGTQLGEFRSNADAASVPEPATLALLGLALLAMVTFHRHRLRRR